MGTLGIRSHVVVVLSFLGLAAACGGPSDPPPAPLGRRFEDKFLAQVPLDQRKAEIEAKQQYDIAVLEQQKAEADYNESRVQLDVAKNERDAARLDEKSAESRAKAAKDSADMTRMNESEKEIKAAKAAREAADKRYEYLTAYRNWLKRLMRWTLHNQYWKEAQWELAQAKVAQSNNIQPQGFNPDEYAKQEQDRARRTADYKAKVDADRETAMSARTKWLAIQKEADKLLGKTSEFPDPMAPKQVKGVNPDMGAGGYTLGSGTDTKSDDEVQPVQDPTKEEGAESPQ